MANGLPAVPGAHAANSVGASTQVLQTVDYATIQSSKPWILLRAPKRAIELAHEGVAHNRTHSESWLLLGVAAYATQDWKGSLEALQKARQFRDRDEGRNLFLLAMAHGRLGQLPQAEKSYQQAVRWMADRNPRDLELRRLRSQAAALLGIPELPAQAKEKSPQKGPPR